MFHSPSHPDYLPDLVLFCQSLSQPHSQPVNFLHKYVSIRFSADTGVVGLLDRHNKPFMVPDFFSVALNNGQFLVVKDACTPFTTYKVGDNTFQDRDLALLFAASL